MLMYLLIAAVLSALLLHIHLYDTVCLHFETDYKILLMIFIQ